LVGFISKLLYSRRVIIVALLVKQELWYGQIAGFPELMSKQIKRSG